MSNSQAFRRKQPNRCQEASKFELNMRDSPPVGDIFVEGTVHLQKLELVMNENCFCLNL